MPLVCGANHFLAACVRPVASSAGSSHGDSRSFPPLRLFIDMSKVHKLIKPITKSLFPNALSDIDSRNRWDNRGQVVPKRPCIFEGISPRGLAREHRSKQTACMPPPGFVHTLARPGIPVAIVQEWEWPVQAVPGFPLLWNRFGGAVLRSAHTPLRFHIVPRD